MLATEINCLSNVMNFNYKFSVIYIFSNYFTYTLCAVSKIKQHKNNQIVLRNTFCLLEFISPA